MSKPPKARTITIFNTMADCERATGIKVPVQRAAKRDGCKAFVGQRVHSVPLLKWVKDHPQAVKEALKGVEANQELAALKARQIVANTQILDHRLALSKGELVLRSEVAERMQWEIPAIHEEAKLLMETEVYRQFCFAARERFQSKFDEAQADGDAATKTPEHCSID